MLVETERGPTLAHRGRCRRARRSVTRPLHRVVKKADARDLAREDRNLQRERELHAHRARRSSAGAGRQYKLVKVESALDGSRVTVFFAAEERLDLRDLVRDLADALHTRIEMKQIGARDEAKLAGGARRRAGASCAARRGCASSSRCR